MSDRDEMQRRWRLILGKDAEGNGKSDGEGGQSSKLDAIDLQRDQSLDYLYNREYQNRSQARGDKDSLGREGSLDPSSPTAVTWLNKTRQLFPKSTVDYLQKEAIDRYQMLSLLTDKEVLAKATPSIELIHTLLSFKNHLPKELMSEVRRVIQKVCAEIEDVLAQKVLSQFSSRRIRHLSGGRRQFTNLDWHRSIRENLHNYIEEEDSIILENLRFYQRQQQQIPWDLYIVIDQSGSMFDNVIHSAVLGSIFCRLRALKSHLILFDTNVVDMTEQMRDPVETLLAVQLGGGTDIGKAMRYTSDKINQPHRSIVVLISDFYEGANPAILFEEIKVMRDSGVKLLGLSALSSDTNADYCEHTARELVDLGMDIGAMTPDHLAKWIADTIR